MLSPYMRSCSETPAASSTPSHSEEWRRRGQDQFEEILPLKYKKYIWNIFKKKLPWANECWIYFAVALETELTPYEACWTEDVLGA